MDKKEFFLINYINKPEILKEEIGKEFKNNKYVLINLEHKKFEENFLEYIFKMLFVYKNKGKKIFLKNLSDKDLEYIEKLDKIDTLSKMLKKK